MEVHSKLPSEIRQQVWTELQRATRDRHHAWRTPVLASTGAGGIPKARTVVLREVDASLSRFHFYTDRRSPKVTELVAQPTVSLVFWNKGLSWQLRVRALMTIHTSGPVVDTAWERVRQSAAAGDYLSPGVPGAILSTEVSDVGPEADQHHLAILTAQVQEIDWLELGRSGHRRAKFGVDTWDWLTP